MKARQIAYGAFTALAMVLLLFGSGSGLHAGDFQPCRVPPVVSFGVQPNVLIILDYSGSMQWPAYYPDNSRGAAASKVYNCYDSGMAAVYDPTRTYYGSFDADVYYQYDSTNHYFEAADPQPVIQYEFSGESAEGATAGTIRFTAAGHDFQVGDLVVLYGLTSHTHMNAKAFEVTHVGGDEFWVQAPWGGTPDEDIGYAVKRVQGSLDPDSATGVVPGISGNILNFAISSRVDAALRALMGGKAVSSSTEDICYVQSQGARQFVSESTNVHADFYVRPATLEDPATGAVRVWPNDWDTGTYQEKDRFVSIMRHYGGSLTSADPIYYSKYFEEWTFTLTETTHVEMELDGVWSNGSNDYLSIYNTSIENSGDCATYTGDNSAQIHSSQGNPAKISADLAAGTYYIRATYSNTACATGDYVLKSNINLDPYEPTGFTGSHDGAAKDSIGSLAWARVRIKKDKDERRGVIQETFPYVRYGFMYYKGDVKANKGKMLVGCDNKDLNLLLEAIQGIDNNASDGLDFTEAFPYGNTPTGPSLAETYDYFNQHSNSDHADNSLFVGTSTEGSIRDPYYDTDASGNPVPIPCRKSFVLLVSDGEWNDGSDPVGEAQKIHVGDVRPDSNFPDLPGDQNADIYTIYAFNDQIGGSNSMKAIAMYGGFGEIAGCGTTNFPYPKSGTPSDSKTFSWPVAGCDPTATYDETCCAEWDVVFDRNEDGIEEQKGVPDNYYEASDGVELEDSLKRILTEVISRYSSASAVATVSQELRTGDLVVRAAFDAADPTKLDRYIWWGHVEIYEPREEYDGKYDFEFNCNAGLVCSDMPGPIGSDCPSGRRCWDMGLNLRSVVGSARTIFTSINDVQVPFDTVNVTYSDLGVVDDAAAADLINWVKGDYVSGYRTRTQSTETPGVTPEWKLGDIVYSTPVVVGPPALGDVSKRDPNIESFYTYRNDNIHRKKMIYVGANDGMLHAFVMSKYIDGEWVHDPDEDPSGEIGTEAWAYIPSNMLSELKDFAAATYGSQLGCTHRPAVDLAPRSWEAYIHPYGDPTVPKEWRTLVVGGQRRGGDMYFCIDVSDPDNPILLWEYSVLKHRVVVEVGSADAEDVCLQGCRADVQDNCEAQRLDCRQNCYNTYLADPTGGEKACKKDAACQTCMNNCDTTKVDVCVPDGEADCDAQCAALSTGYRAYTPFADVYESIKILPMSWSRPYLTRLKIPTDVSFYVGEISADGLPLEKMTFTEGEDQIREVVFIGGGIHVYDKDFTTVPDIDPRFKLALFSPFMLLMDIQTGENLFEYVWPIVNNRTFHDFNVFPLETAEENEIPYAMSDPVALDVWNDATDRPGDDGFMDRVYVGGLNGYLYGIKFNLDETPADTSNTNMGILVDIWPTKTIDLKDDRWTNNYRGSRQPITAGLAASFEPETSDAGAGSFLRVIFGTGKYDDVPGGKDDKSDTTKMALYNLRDPVTQPVLSDTDSYEVYTAGYLTNFRVQLDLHCAEVSGNKLAYQGFNTGCTWLDPSTGDPDCCESDCSYDYSVDPPTAPCYACIYDLTHPVDIGAGERFVGKPLIAGGLVFATSYLPPTDPCDPIGKGYLYIFDYMCRPFPPGFTVLKDELLYVVSHMQTGSGDAGQTYGTVVELGEGVPSEPILDSRGDNVIIQMSDATLLKIGVNLPIKRLQTKGWIDR